MNVVTRPPIRVVLADDAYLVREALKHLLLQAPDIAVVGECADARAVVDVVDAQRADLLITDIRMPPSQQDEGIRLATSLRRSHPALGVIVLSAYAEVTYALKLFAGGADGRGYLLKDRIRDRAQILEAVTRVADGGFVIEPQIVEGLASSHVSATSSPPARAHPARARDPGAHRRGQEQRGDRGDAGPHEAGGREARQLDLRQARPRRPRAGQPARDGGPRLPQRPAPAAPRRHPERVGSASGRGLPWRHPRKRRSRARRTRNGRSWPLGPPRSACSPIADDDRSVGRSSASPAPRPPGRGTTVSGTIPLP